ncbi:hypothetical protein EG873_15870, partial [Enterococcus faecalis]
GRGGGGGGGGGRRASLVAHKHGLLGERPRHRRPPAVHGLGHLGRAQGRGERAAGARPHQPVGRRRVARQAEQGPEPGGEEGVHDGRGPGGRQQALGDGVVGQH